MKHIALAIGMTGIAYLGFDNDSVLAFVGSVICFLRLVDYD